MEARRHSFADVKKYGRQVNDMGADKGRGEYLRRR